VQALEPHAFYHGVALPKNLPMDLGRFVMRNQAGKIQKNIIPPSKIVIRGGGDDSKVLERRMRAWWWLYQITCFG
jgi:hypothetical protein